MSDIDPSSGPPVISGFVTTVETWQKHFREHGAVLMRPPILATLIIVAGLGYWLGYSKRSDITDVLKEKSDFQTSVIEAYKDRLQVATPDEAAKRFSTLETKLAEQDKQLQLFLPKKKRLITDDLDARFASRIDSLKQDIRFLIIYAYPIGDSTFFAEDLYRWFKAHGIKIQGIENVVCDDSQRGVLVGITDPNKPSPEATDFVKILTEMGLHPNTTKWETNDNVGQDFDLFICPEATISPQVTLHPIIPTPPPETK
jgi:hypothetical protein